MARDLVCGEEVDVRFHTPKKLVSGVVYHFCSDTCRDKFADDPSAYLKQRVTH